MDVGFGSHSGPKSNIATGLKSAKNLALRGSGSHELGEATHSGRYGGEQKA